MPLHPHLSPRVETLFAALTDDLAAHWPEDPLEAVPIVVGSGELRRWLVQELATRFGSAAAFAFVGPRAAYLSLSAAILGGGDPLSALAAGVRAEEEGWSGPTLHYRVLELLRARLDQPAFTRVAGYLREGASTEAAASGAVVTPRELAFSGEVAGCLERLLHERPDESLAWAEDPDRAPAEHRWLAELLAALGAHAAPKDPATSAWGPSPARKQFKRVPLRAESAEVAGRRCAAVRSVPSSTPNAVGKRPEAGAEVRLRGLGGATGMAASGPMVVRDRPRSMAPAGVGHLGRGPLKRSAGAAA